MSKYFIFTVKCQKMSLVQLGVVKIVFNKVFF